MIHPYQCVPRSITRRNFGKIIVGGAAAASGLLPTKAYASDPTFTIAMIPDPQFLAGENTCSGSTAYNALVDWGINNRNLVVNGTPLNIKGFVSVGDCQDNSTEGIGTSTNADNQRVIAAGAMSRIFAAGMFSTFCAGNHDYGHIVIVGRPSISYIWTAGEWSPTNMASMFGGGIDILGSGDTAVWGGVYADTPASTVNNYVRLHIGGRKILLITLEYYPRSAVLNWARGLHDTYRDHEVWIATHGYLRVTGTQMGRSDPNGPGTSGLWSSAPGSNSGTEMWAGSDATWAGFVSWPRVKMIMCGHDNQGYLGGSNWVWRHNTKTATPGQSVEEVFCNCQDNDYNLSFCTGGNPAVLNGTSDTAHLMLLRISPTTIESFLVSTNSGKWTGGQGVLNQSSPVQLFNVPFVGAVEASSPARGNVAPLGSLKIGA